MKNSMQEIPRAILLPPPSQFSQRVSARAVQIDSDSIIDQTRRARRDSSGTAQTFLTLLNSRPEDTVEIRGKQFRFRPYTQRGTGDAGVGNAPHTDDVADAVNIDTGADDGDVSADILDGFSAGAHGRNSSAFIASFIAQQRLRQGLHNPPYAAASDAYRRAGGSPSMIDSQPRVVSVAV